jgi:glycosyltransferase involved in cell wall biosynthesis
VSASAKTALLIAYHYPPCSVSSGLQRTLAFSRHLVDYGWQPVVLTVKPSAYDRASPESLRHIPPHVLVERSFTIDTARDLAFKGRYWSRLTIPDRWGSWWFTGVRQGQALIRKHRIGLIWSTYPIATAHRIGATLARKTGLPWIADFRDPMVEFFPETGERFPADPALRNARLRIEERVMERAACATFCTESALQIARERYPGTRAAMEVIPNGYDEMAFEDAERARSPAPLAGQRKVLLHSGTIYPGPDRDPSALFAAVRTLAAEGVARPEILELRLRDPANVEYFRKLAQDQGVADFVTIAPPLPYREALAEMLNADGLLLLQGRTSNAAVPAKLYEYLRARRPIVALVDAEGETAATLRNLRVDSMAPLTDAAGIAQLLRAWLTEPSSGSRVWQASAADSESFSRRKLTGRLAGLFDDTVRANAAAAAP